MKERRVGQKDVKKKKKKRRGEGEDRNQKSLSIQKNKTQPGCFLSITFDQTPHLRALGFSKKTKRMTFQSGDGRKRNGGKDKPRSEKGRKKEGELCILTFFAFKAAGLNEEEGGEV
ncbi:hypothetical protein WMY93_025699 [Mugilogobius chulae]|uniref:Uncharacterized protein n=1 Tax=Mugilogobius chulae TaxID=88201 RepID=A0AAW0N4W6_9GOBI